MTRTPSLRGPAQPRSSASPAPSAAPEPFIFPKIRKFPSNTPLHLSDWNHHTIWRSIGAGFAAIRMDQATRAAAPRPGGRAPPATRHAPAASPPLSPRRRNAPGRLIRIRPAATSTRAAMISQPTCSPSRLQARRTPKTGRTTKGGGGTERRDSRRQDRSTGARARTGTRRDDHPRSGTPSAPQLSLSSPAPARAARKAGPPATE